MTRMPVRPLQLRGKPFLDTGETHVTCTLSLALFTSVQAGLRS